MGMVLYGMNDTRDVTDQMMINHAKAVKKAAHKSLVFFDLPFQKNFDEKEIITRVKNIHKNTDMTIGNYSFTFRVFGVDYNEYFQFKHKYNHLLRGRPKGVEIDTHWSLQEQKPLY